ncbi:hypothetical protein HN011_002410 [Eciton burchellii]|nr:hypothetical protein HN011_002410 [Eciton burchellii]
MENPEPNSNSVESFARDPHRLSHRTAVRCSRLERPVALPLQMTLQVSWVRHRDVHLLTIGRYTYTNDQRFRAIHNAHSDDWTLQIKYPQHRDSGIYECQVSTTPHMSHLVHLNVIGKCLLDQLRS